jgi:hypothetical protein
MTTVKLTHFGVPFENENGSLNIHNGPVNECPSCEEDTED